MIHPKLPSKPSRWEFSPPPHPSPICSPSRLDEAGLPAVWWGGCLTETGAGAAGGGEIEPSISVTFKDSCLGGCLLAFLPFFPLPLPPSPPSSLSPSLPPPLPRDPGAASPICLDRPLSQQFFNTFFSPQGTGDGRS